MDSFSNRSSLVGKEAEEHSLLLIYFIAFFGQSLGICSVAGPVLGTVDPEMNIACFLLSKSCLLGETGKRKNRSNTM